ncbi:calcium-binding protein [Rhizobium sp. TRM95796]|uniref:calcium-binding protein n=1 Tax=Rhizobium sp. TRM95796 TaxID=2979862 RepID=UPI0021E79A8F|nr:calcium-binding protein [Rhizobium sp. TRM95796]MCV3769038.1 calcium-binding protein [Rhizobium sp. TRM95796]
MTTKYGTDAAETIIGSNETDLLVGMGGADNLIGLFGSDTMSGGDGRDQLDGGFQSDTLMGDEDDDRLNGGSGDDTFLGGSGADTMQGGLGDDTFTDNQIDDYQGDVIDGGLGRDTVRFFLSGRASGVNFTAADPTETVTLYGARLHDIEQYYIDGSNTGADTLTGGRWNDFFQGNGGADRLDGQGGADYLSGGAGADMLIGGQGDDYINGGDDKDRLLGGYGDDNLSGGNGDDALDGGNGVDALHGEDGNDELVAGAGNDYLSGGLGNDTLDGGVGNDYIITGDGNDKVLAGAGDDEILFTVDSGKKIIDGGAGVDRLELRYIDGNFTAKAENLVNRLADGTTIQHVEAYDLHGSNGANQFTTLGGNDDLYGYGGDDTLRSGAGNDTLQAGDGRDKLYGEAGNDTLIAQGEKDLLDGGTGLDTAYLYVDSYNQNMTFNVSKGKGVLSNGTTAANTEIFNVFTGSGSDTLKAGDAQQVWFKSAAGNDKLYGGKGDDFLDAGIGRDFVDGGAGDDKIMDMGGDNTLIGGDGNDEVDITVMEQSSDGLSKVSLGAGNDSVQFNAGLGDIYGSLEADGGSGVDFAEVDRGETTKNLSFVLSANARLVNGDAILKNFEQVHISGGSGDDKFTGGKLTDTFEGNDGADALNGLGGNDWLYGGAGRDNLKGGDGDDHLYAGHMSIEADRDVLDAGAGNDDIYINSGDQAAGGAGSDRLHLDVSALNVGVSFTLTSGTVKVNASTTVSGMEALDFFGTSGADSVTAAAGSDTLRGNVGNDELKGMAGADVLYDGAGDDKLYGGDGDDQLVRNEFTGKDLFDGGAGLDTLAFNFYGDSSVKLDLADNAENDGLAKGLTVRNVERVTGTDKDDDIRGANGGEHLDGGSGDDVLFGRGGNDTLVGGLDGDLLSGGSGKDVFVFSSAFDAGDEITDFTRGQDRLSVNAINFDMTGKKAVNVVVSDEVEFSAAAPTFLFESDTHRLWFDADGKAGDEEAVLLATLDDVKTLSQGDFMLV